MKSHGVEILNKQIDKPADLKCKKCHEENKVVRLNEG